jgi:hypothetical protein
MAMLCTLNLFAQTTRTGKVNDEKGLPIQGVTVQVKGKTMTAKTNADGSFTINALPSDVLAFRSLGFESQEISVGNQNNLNVVLAQRSMSWKRSW